MRDFAIEKRRSYLLCLQFDESVIQSMADEGSEDGFLIVNCGSLEELSWLVDRVQHCLGIFVSNSVSLDHEASLIDLSLNHQIPIRFFSSSPFVPDSLRVGNEVQPREYIHKYIQDLVPQKFRELCLFAVGKVTKNLIPDYQTTWNVSIAGNNLETQDFIIFCESLFDNFICAVTIRSSVSYVESKSDGLKGLPNQEIMEYFSEFCNQVLGLINVNLRKINIHSRIGLPIVITGPSVAEFKKRSSFFLPVLTLSDADSGISVTFQFLVPFMKNVSFSKSLDFEISELGGHQKLDML